MRDYSIPRFSPQLVIPTSFEECLTYGQRQMYMWKVIQEQAESIADLQERVTALENQLTEQGE